jgi:hypothetical protein
MIFLTTPILKKKKKKKKKMKINRNTRKSIQMKCKNVMKWECKISYLKEVQE